MKRRKEAKFSRWVQTFKGLGMPFPDAYRTSTLKRYFNRGYSPIETWRLWGDEDAQSR